MGLSINELKSLSFGYLTGADLKQYASPELLIKQYSVDPDSLNNGVLQAYSEAIGALSRKYNVQTELEKFGFCAAIIEAVIAAGVVTGLTVVNAGLGYVSAPTLAFTGGGGSGAAATVTIAEGKINGSTISAGGSNYTKAPTVTLAGGVPVDTRAVLFVKILSILAVRNVFGNMQSISDYMLSSFKWADTTLKDIRNGQMNIPLNTPALPVPSDPLSNIESKAKLVNNSFSTLG